MRQLNVYALFHLNLAFSSIEEEQRPEIVLRCYWPLLRLPEAIAAPIAIEATGFTLETINAIDPKWIAELRRLISLGFVEFVGSGFAQLIGPLVPARVNRANLELGQQSYQAILGSRATCIGSVVRMLAGSLAAWAFFRSRTATRQTSMRVPRRA